MNQDAFVEERKDRWKNLSALLERSANNGIREFSAEEIKLLGSLYRKACSDLSYARSRKYSHELIRYLNQLVGKAYGIIYLADKEHRGTIIKFFKIEFPKLFRENRKYIYAAIIMFFISVAIAYAWDQANPNFSRFVVPREFLEIWDKTGNESAGESAGAAAFPMMSAWYLTHNFQVGVMSFVSGIFFGLGTGYFVISNGIIMGAITSLVLRANYHTPFFNFIICHLFFELMAIFICAGAGLLIAKSIIAPGDMTVKDALNENGKVAVKLVLGTIPMFLAAGIIEASISRMDIPFFIKVIFSLSTVAFMIWYFSFDHEKARLKRKYLINS